MRPCPPVRLAKGGALVLAVVCHRRWWLVSCGAREPRGGDSWGAGGSLPVLLARLRGVGGGSGRGVCRGSGSADRVGRGEGMPVVRNATADRARSRLRVGVAGGGGG